MCEKCVADGVITEDQNERLKAGASPISVLTPEQIQNIYNSVGPDSDKSPDQLATERMDGSAEILVDFILSKRSTVSLAAGEGTGGSPKILTAPHALDKFLEALAGEIMFKTEPSAVAYALAVISDRYVALLEQWAKLYVAAAEDVEDVFVDLDQASTPESRVAVVKATQVPRTEASTNTGMYL